MKFLFIGLLFFNVAFAQDGSLPINQKGIVEFSDVVVVDSMSADKLYSKAKLFIAKSFVSGKHVTQLEDDAAKTIVINGRIVVLMKGFMVTNLEGGTFKFQLTIACKDNKYKYSFTDFTHEGADVTGYRSHDLGPIEKSKSGDMAISKKQWDNYKDQVRDNITILISALKKVMADKSDDW